MRLKQFNSWYLALAGILLQILLGFSILSTIKTTGVWGEFFGALFGFAFLFFAALGILPLLLLAFQRTRKIGGIVSIIVGILGLLTVVGIVIGIFLIVAGILAFWKKI
jgi:ABC-type transport system involved in multi-copper enzyme maturation permease subunit